MVTLWDLSFWFTSPFCSKPIDPKSTSRKTWGLKGRGFWNPIATLLPPDGLGSWINQYAGGMFGASLLSLLISIPLYVCATASVPIAAALVEGGLPLGAALVFLMAGPATNVATIGAVRSELGNRTTIVYLLTVVVGSLLLGLGFDFILEVPNIELMNHEHSTWWAQLSAILLMGIFTNFIWEEIQMKSSNVTTENSRHFSVKGMTCNGCVGRLQKVLDATDGIRNSNVTLEPGQAVIDATLSDNAIIQIIEGAGFEASST